jgi:hypothetical protein
MASVKVHQAKTNLSRLIERARRGEEVVMSRKVRLGRLSGAEELAADFASILRQEGFETPSRNLTFAPRFAGPR